MVRPISRRFAEDAILIRQSAGGRGDDGVFVSGAEEQIPIRVATAPVPSKSGISEMRDVLPEGARHSEQRTFWVTMPLEALRRGSSASDSDYIEYNGQVFRVEGVSVWETNGLTQVDAVLPDAGDETVPSGSDEQSFANAPVLYPLGEVHGVPDTPIHIEIPHGEVTTLDTGLTRGELAGYHTLGLSAFFPTFLQLISVRYLQTHDGLDTPVGFSTPGHRVTIHLELNDTLEVRFDLRATDIDVSGFQIRGIG